MKNATHEVRLIHNPTAGAAEHDKKQLISLINSYGFSCGYSSSKKKFLRAINPETEIIAVAGGDGTIRKTVLRLLDKKLKFKRPIAILPLGTANNIATSLGISADHNHYISSWKENKLKKLDVGYVSLGNDGLYFIESFGFGVFPALMKTMDKKESPASNDPEDEIKLALNSLIKLISNYEPFHCKITCDEEVLEDEFLMVEVMNIPRLGPRLILAPEADPGDGLFAVVTVRSNQRENLIAYLSALEEGKKIDFPFPAISVAKLAVEWKTTDVHVDDEQLKLGKKGKAEIYMLRDLVEVIV